MNKSSEKKKIIQVLYGYSADKLGSEIYKWIHEWSEIKNTDVDNKFKWLLNNLSKSVSSLLQNKHVQINNDFFDNEMESMRIKKNMLYKNAQIARDDNNKWKEYRTYKNKYKQRIQEKKYQTTQRKFDKVAGDQKGMWKVLKNILNDENDQINEIIDGDKIYKHDQTIANEFNKYFVDTIKNINNTIPTVNYQDIQILDQNVNEFKIEKISISQLKNHIKEMKKRNSRDSFNISVNILQDSIFDQEIFPSILKNSVVIPIQKISSTNKINEFRPINTLPTVERLIEKIVYDQLAKFVDRNNILCSQQSGFRKSHSCESAVNLLLDEWKSAMDSNETTVAVFLDFQRAFETIDRSILLKKLKNIGVHGKARKWFKCYLNNRSQIVRVNNIFSTELTNDLGVPQGSILGPLLFLIYINNIINYLENAKIKLFADDTVIYCSHRDVDTCVRNMNIELENLSNVIYQHKLKLNITKTKAMIISKKKDNNYANIKISINNEEIDIVDKVKYLGIYMDKNLNFNEHVNEIIKKIGKKVGVLNRIGNKLNIQQKIQFYKSCIECHMNYCSTILFLANEKDLNRLQILQNKCMRNILRTSKCCSAEKMLDVLELMSFKKRILFNVVYINMYKIVNKIWPSYLSSKIKFNYKNERKNTLRNRNQIVKPIAKKAYMQNTLFYKGIDLYNKLPANVKNIEKIETFKNKLKEYIK